MKVFLERPLAFVSLAYAVGVVLGTLTRCWIPWISFVGIGLAAFGLLLFYRTERIFLAAAFLFLVSAGAVSYQLNQITPGHDVSNPEFHGWGSLQGRVISEVDQKEKGKKEIVSFTLRVESWWRRHERIRLSGKVRVTLLNAGTIPSFGDEVRLRGTLSFPKSAMNPGEFDYRSYLEKQNIRASFLGFGKKSLSFPRKRESSVVGRLKAETLDSRFRGNDNKHPGIWVLRKIFDLRRAIHERVYALAPAPERDILLSLITGERANIPREITDDFIRTGTVHVLAISGFQISLVAGFTFLLLRGLGISLRMAALVSGAVLVLYVPLAGWQLPVQRAGIMGLVLLGAVMLARGSDVISSIFFAFFILLLINPNHLYSIAFQLSFISVLSILGLVPRFSEGFWIDSGTSSQGSGFPWWMKLFQSVKILFATTLAATLGTWPLVLFYFHVLSFTSLAANFLIVPLTTFALFSLIFVLAVSFVWMGAASFLMPVPVFLVQMAELAAHGLGRFPLGTLYLPSPHWIFLILYYLFLLAFVFGIYRPWHPVLKKTFALGALGICLALVLPIFRSREELVMLNVPGSSVIFAEDRAGHKVLFNGGRGQSVAQDYWTVIPFLKARGVKKLDAVFMTSVKRKYWTGLARISDHFRVQSLIVPWPYSRDKDFGELLRKVRREGGGLPGLIPGSRFLVSESMAVDVMDRALKLHCGEIQVLMLGEEDPALALSEARSGHFEILYMNGKNVLIAEVLQEIARLKPEVLVLANGPSRIEEPVKSFLARHQISLFNLREAGALTLRPKHDGFELRTMK